MSSSATVPQLVQLGRQLVHHHRQTAPGDRIRLLLPPELTRTELADVCLGAGFLLKRRLLVAPSVLHRFRTLPDTVAGDMALLICGLNPSPASADAGVGFARPGNRFWPGAIAAGLLSEDRDPDRALCEHGIGMTDLVKRTTRRADELTSDEYVAGLARLTRMSQRLQPRAICMVGLAGWRVAVDKHANAGWQSVRLGQAPVYLMPSTSGLNASSQLGDLSEHFSCALKGP